jgi:capsular polysaccharide export protein
VEPALRPAMAAVAGAVRLTVGGWQVGVIDATPRDAKQNRNVIVASMKPKSFLFLQGPTSTYFALVGDGLRKLGHGVHRINLCYGDRLFWRRDGAVDYRGRPADWPAFIADFVDRHGITDIVLLGEQRDYHKAAIAAAQDRGIRVTVTDFGYLRPDWITLERDGMSGHSRFPRDPEEILKLGGGLPKIDMARVYADSFWTLAFYDMLYHFSTILLWWKFPHYESHQLHRPLPIYIGTGLRLLFARYNQMRARRAIARLNEPKRRYFLFPLQMETDFQLRIYSKFPDLTAAIETVIGSFARHAPADRYLLVKVHPLDPGLRNWRRRVARIAGAQGVADRVVYVDGGNLDHMIGASDGVVTINSTVGVRALYLDSPLIALGQAVYVVPGLTFQGPLDAFWTGAAPPDPVLRDAFMAAVAATIQVRGVYYRQPGLGVAVEETVHRLHHGLINAVATHAPSGSTADRVPPSALPATGVA